MVEKDGGTCNLHFFRLLLPGFFERLALPTACVKLIVKEKCNMTTATITSPNGESWHVDVCRSSMQARMYFDGERWLKFVHAYNLGPGYFLVFCYKGNMMFSFRAYDLSSCEITSYASISSHNGDVKGDVKNKGTIPEEKNTSIEKKKISKVKIEDQNDIDECSFVKKRKLSESKLGNKKISNEFTTVQKKKISKEEVESKKKTESSAYNRRMNSLHHERITINSWSEKARFEATINHCNVCKPYMNIPWKFCDSIGLTNHRELILMDPKDRRWFVRLHHRRVLFGSRRNRSSMGTGWDKFALANQMKVGDKYVFKLVPKNNCEVVTLEVQVGKETL